MNTSLDTFQVLESIPQIPIHVTEIKKLILKDNPGFTVESCLDEERLLSVLTNGSTGRNPTFFKAYGHEDVFGLKAAMPEGCSTLELVENVPSLDDTEETEQGQKTTESNVLYVRLPEGHPVITASSEENSLETPESNNELSIEEAIEKAEFVFDDGLGDNDEAEATIQDSNNSVSEPVKVEIEAETLNTPSSASSNASKRCSPRISPRTPISPKVDLIDSDAKLAEALSKSHHNLRPKRPLRHVQALKQQAKRRKRNTALASGNSSSSPHRVSSARKSTFNANGDIEIHFSPSQPLSDLHTMKDVLTSISGKIKVDSQWNVS